MGRDDSTTSFQYYEGEVDFHVLDSYEDKVSLKEALNSPFAMKNFPNADFREVYEATLSDDTVGDALHSEDARRTVLNAIESSDDLYNAEKYTVVDIGPEKDGVCVSLLPDDFASVWISERSATVLNIIETVEGELLFGKKEDNAGDEFYVAVSGFLEPEDYQLDRPADEKALSGLEDFYDRIVDGNLDMGATAAYRELHEELGVTSTHIHDFTTKGFLIPERQIEPRQNHTLIDGENRKEPYPPFVLNRVTVDSEGLDEAFERSTNEFSELKRLDSDLLELENDIFGLNTERALKALSFDTGNASPVPFPARKA